VLHSRIHADQGGAWPDGAPRGWRGCRPRSEPATRWSRPRALL